MFWWINSFAMFSQEVSGKFITAHYSKDMLAEVDINSYIKVLPSVPVLWSNCFRNFLSVQKYSLRYSTIFYFGFSDVNSSIIQVIINYTFPYSVVLIRVFHNWFFEISSKTQTLSIIFEPFWLIPWYILVFWLWNIAVLHCPWGLSS